MVMDVPIMVAPSGLWLNPINSAVLAAGEFLYTSTCSLVSMDLSAVTFAHGS